MITKTNRDKSTKRRPRFAFIQYVNILFTFSVLNYIKGDSICHAIERKEETRKQ